MREPTNVPFDYDLIIVGGGIIGINLAHVTLQNNPKARVLVLEAGDAVAPANSQTASCSHVVHAGVYYKPGSLKSEFCKAGNKWTKQFCKDNDIPLDECGKLIVATDREEVAKLHELADNARQAGLEIEELSKEDIHFREPHIVGLEAILVKDTAVTDFTKVTQTLARMVEDMGGVIKTRSRVTHIFNHNTFASVVVNGVDKYAARHVAVCAGIQADRLGDKAGFKLDFRMVPFRGEYYRLPSEFDDLTESLIYPVPDPTMPFLGVHLTKSVYGFQTVGPNAVLGFDRNRKKKLSFKLRDTYDTLAFKGFWKFASHWVMTGVKEQFESLSKPAYAKRVKKYAPSVEAKDFLPHPCGIRAQAVKSDGTLIEDFDVRTLRSVTLCVNVPSPAATSARPIAEHLHEKILSSES